MRAPAFWDNRPDRPGWRAHLLAPAAATYAAATAARLRRPVRFRPHCPVICVGNINVGGTGKTPTVIALAQWLTRRGLVVHVVSRGHGGRLRGPVEVDANRHRSAEVGDEPLLIAAFARVFVGRDRAQAAKLAAPGADVLLMDDGYQNPALARDVSLVVVDAQTGFGNGRVIPAGPLREPVATGLKRADAVIAVGAPAARERLIGDWPMLTQRTVLAASLGVLETGLDWRGIRALAFAGIGRPEKFFASLRELGVDLVRTVALDDHQPLPAALVVRLKADADRTGAQLVTTEKDAIRLPDRFRSQVLTLPVRLNFDDMGALEAVLRPILP